jgi:hypothetical protein
MRASSLLLCISLWVASTVADEQSDVIDLHPEIFKSIVNAQELMLVEFFAPWQVRFKCFMDRIVDLFLGVVTVKLWPPIMRKLLPP